ncbi:hypothetical protein B296_00039842 [Ensete ventricosum]|uniref:Uncharacterized protein n=1 Tax=Ensete ventricosum TaxID=4639 RepID=A0A426XIA5_ENSVE|nr:hypothetical protein B296_00039842 [Ensete ventricosum]
MEIKSMHQIKITVDPPATALVGGCCYIGRALSLWASAALASEKRCLVRPLGPDLIQEATAPADDLPVGGCPLLTALATNRSNERIEQFYASQFRHLQFKTNLLLEQS